ASEVEQTYIRARQLCQHLEDPYQLFPVLRGLYGYYHVRAEYRTAQELGEQLMVLAQQVHESSMLIAAYRALGATLSCLGAVVAAHAHFTQSLALYDPQQHRASAFRYGEDAGVVCGAHDAWALWRLGYPDQGRVRSDEAVILAQQIAHPYSLSFALSWAAQFHQFRREVCVTQARAAAAIRLSQEQGFAQWMAISSIVHGWALAHQGQAQEGIEQLTQGLRAFRATGAAIQRPHFLALLAEAYGMMGQPEE